MLADHLLKTKKKFKNLKKHEIQDIFIKANYNHTEIFSSPQVKRWAIITYKHSIYKLPKESLNDLRLRILGN